MVLTVFIRQFSLRFVFLCLIRSEILKKIYRPVYNHYIFDNFLQVHQIVKQWPKGNNSLKALLTQAVDVKDNKLKTTAPLYNLASISFKSLLNKS